MNVNAIFKIYRGNILYSDDHIQVKQVKPEHEFTIILSF